MPNNSGMDANFNLNEIKNLLYDISLYLRNELQSLEYQNFFSPKIKNGYNEAKCKDLLDRCEYIMTTLNSKDNHQKVEDCIKTRISAECYLDMSANRKATPSEYVDFNNPNDNEDISYNEKLNQDDDNDDKEIYDICNSSLQTIKSLEDIDIIDCPFIGLPASHLPIQASPKYGQLYRIEKRFFFTQTKKTTKYYCGIMEDWLLCYSDGITSIRPTFCVHLNGNVEHYGEGKRRDTCFQITEFETTKKIIFQATCEIDTKEWIHAVEAAIRGDFNTITGENSVKINNSSSVNNNLRKLPTPPIEKKSYSNNQDAFNDSIYEEPCPLYNINSHMQPSNLVITESDSLKPPDIPIKTGIKTKMSNNINKHEYDVPKPTKSAINILQAPIETCEDTESVLSRAQIEFKSKVKDVQNKLSNHLSSAPSPDRTKCVKKSPSQQSSSSDTKKNTKGQLFKDKISSNTGCNTSASNTPVKNWFLNRINKTSPQSPPKVKPLEKEKENLLSCSEECNTFIPKSSKGGKVNMIINQLEANGHLPIFTRNFGRLSSAFIDSGEDCSYEPIMTTENGKF